MDPSLLKVMSPPSQMSHAKLTILRILQCWVFYETIIEYKPLAIKPSSDGSLTVAIRCNTPLRVEHLNKVLRPERHPFKLRTRAQVEQTGGFTPNENQEFEMLEFLSGFEERFVSFIVEKGFDLAWFCFEQELSVYATTKFSESHDFSKLREVWEGQLEESILELKSCKGRGRGERSSGIWSIQARLDASSYPEPQPENSRVVKKFSVPNESLLASDLSKALRSRLRSLADLNQAISFDFAKNGRKRKKIRSSPVFKVYYFGQEVFKVSDSELCDLLSIPKQKDKYWLLDKKESISQAIIFEGTDLNLTNNTLSTESALRVDETSSMHRPLVQNIPEGARLLAVLGAARRKENDIQIPIPKDEQNADEEDELLSFSLEQGLAKMSSRWVRLNTSTTVFVCENSVPASVFPLGCPGALYACCANALELRGGALRAEGLTLLPPGTLFLLLAHLAFGVTPEGVGKFPSKDDNLDEFVDFCISWVKGKDSAALDESGERGDNKASETDWRSRIRDAINFSRSCNDLGEQLACFPDKVRLLCALFDGVDGYSTNVWSTLDSDPFIPENQSKQRQMASLAIGPTRGITQQNTSSNEDTETDPSPSFSAEINKLNVGDGIFDDAEEDQCVESGRKAEMEMAEEEKKSKESDQILRGREVKRFSDDLVQKSQRMFASELSRDKKMDENELSATNILSIVVKQFYAGISYASFMQPEMRDELVSLIDRRSTIRLNKDHWVIRRFILNGKEWFLALFTEDTLPLKNRSSKEAPRWARYSRPWTRNDALACIPPRFRDIPLLETEIYVEAGDVKMKAVLFEDIAIAIQMEAAFFLEMQFGTKKDHWYQKDFGDLAALMLKQTPPISQVLQAFQRDASVNFTVRTK
jgi:hypothetical protein